ncbi:MAG: S8 family serine peptidase [Chitinophagaceae bacterium]|nr:S8 family serine peptidase [Chitinophagaceae bacterium]
MKHLYTRIARLLALLCFPALLQAQEQKDFGIYLNSGKFIPEENTDRLTNAGIFSKSFYQDKYYVTIQFSSLPDEATKVRLKNAGIELLDYIPNLAYTAAVKSDPDLSVLETLNVRSIFRFTELQKAMPAVVNKDVPAHAKRSGGYADVTVLTYEKMAAGKIIASLDQLGAMILAETPVFRTFSIMVPQENLDELVALPFVQWVEFIDPPNQPENLLGRSLHRSNILNDGIRNLKGDGINISIWDEVASQHLDFSPGRLLNIQTGTAGSHGTHVSGTMAGRGLINPLAKGMAPNATIYSYDYNGDVQVEMSVAIPAYTLISSNHSYYDGQAIQCGVNGTNSAYSLRARNTDINLNNFPYHLHCHSAGNQQTACANGWTTITGTGKAAKNNIVVANITTTETISSSSSFGPMHDGRVKPEISSMGTNVFSTYTPLNSYGTISGTSMATPGITGSVALLVQRYKQLHGDTLPASSLIKNTICNTARDLGNPGPDYKFGFGRINALAAVRILEENRYEINSITTGAVTERIISVPEGTSRLRVMLSWNDPAAAANSAIALVNNLDLSVINGTTTTLPWKLDKNNPGSNATRGIDNISNIEQVTIDDPQAGDYIVRIDGIAITTGPAQEYYLTWFAEMPSIEVIYPNGPENVSPGSSETITWDNAGVTGNQTVEYSLDNGASWVAISSTVPAATTRLAWTVPSGANTSTALIRVSSGALTDVSDANFKILGTVTGLNGSTGVCSGQVNLSWTAVANATQYDIYRLDATAGDYVLAAADVTGTSYIVSGLTPGASIWFTIRAKNSTTGAISERAVAINRTVSTATCTNNCPDPAGLSTTSIGSASATLNWNASPTATSYNVDYKQASSPDWINAATSTTSLSVNLSGLTPSTQYDWRVQSNCSSGSSNYKTAQFATTAVVVCPGPYDVSTNGNRSGAATIPLNTDVKGLVNPSNDNDYYRFVITTGGTITLTLKTLPANYHLALQNSSGSTLQSSTNSGTNNETINRTVSAGTYYARVYPSNSSNWNATNCYTVRVQTGTATRMIEEDIVVSNDNKLTLYPNPANNRLNISIDDLQAKAEIKIYDATGKEVMQTLTSTASTWLDISKIPAGIYMIRVNHDNKESSMKFVKQ